MGDKKLKCYFVSPGEWNLLSFHYTNRQAKVQGYNEQPGFRGEPEYIQWRCWRADDEYMVFAESDEPHTVDCPRHPDTGKWMMSEEIRGWSDALFLAEGNTMDQLREKRRVDFEHCDFADSYDENGKDDG